MENIIFKRPRLKKIAKEGFTPVDMHVHTKYSDGMNNVQTLLKKARKKGFGIAVTDHNHIKGALDAYYARKILVIPGIEISTFDGPHILCYFYNISEIVEFYEKHIENAKLRNPNGRIKLGMVELAERLKNYNCVVSLAHPYSIFELNLPRTLKKYPQCKKMVDFADAIEVISGQQLRSANLRAVDMKNELKKGITGGSDAHTLFDLGNVVTCAEAGNVDDFLESIELKKNFVIGKEARQVNRLISNSQVIKKHSRYWTRDALSYLKRKI